MSHSSERELKELVRHQVICKTRNFQNRLLFNIENPREFQKSLSACGCLHLPFEINRPALKAQIKTYRACNNFKYFFAFFLLLSLLTLFLYQNLLQGFHFIFRGGGYGCMLPQEIFRTEVSQKRIFLKSGKEILL